VEKLYVICGEDICVWRSTALYVEVAFRVTCGEVIRPTQSIMYIPFQVNIFHRSILLIVQYKYLKSCSEDLFLKDPTKI